MWLFRLKSLYYLSISRVLRKYTSTRALSTRLDYSVKKEASNSFVRLFSNESNSECCSHQTIKRKRRWWSQSITSREPFTTFPIGPLSVWWYGVSVENLLHRMISYVSTSPPPCWNKSWISRQPDNQSTHCPFSWASVKVGLRLQRCFCWGRLQHATTFHSVQYIIFVGMFEEGWVFYSHFCPN